MSLSSDFFRHSTGFRQLWAAVAAFCLLIPSAGFAQNSKTKKGAADAEKKTGTIAEVKKKGKGATITVEEADGEKFDIEVGAKTNFVVHAKGDKTFFKHGSMQVSSERVVLNRANGYLHGAEFTIYLGGKGPGDQFEQDPLSTEVLKIAGTVTSGDDESFTIEADGNTHMIGFDPGGVSVSVESTDPEHAAVGSKIDIEGVTRAGKFHPNSIAVTNDRPMTADEAFAGGDKKSSKSKTAGKTNTKKGTGKTDKTAKKNSDKSDAGDKDKGGDKDPFGVLGDSGKKDQKPADGSAPKKDKKSSKDSDSNN